jgi:DHA2 family multidrug resistance protein
MIIWRYAAIPFIFTPLNAASLLLLPAEKVRMGSGLINIMQQGLGGAIGLAVMTTLLQRRTAVHISLLDQQQAFSALPWSEVMGQVHEVVRQATGGGASADVTSLAMVGQHLQQQATVLAYQDCFFVLALLTLAVMPFVCFLRRRRTA